MKKRGSIKSKLVILMIIILIGMAVSFINQINKLSIILDQEKILLNKEMLTELGKYVTDEVQDILTNVSNYITTLEEEVDKNMLSSALLIREIDILKDDLNMDDINYVNDLTNMSDIYITDENGIFIYSTEEAALGLNIFDIDPDYKNIVSGEIASMQSGLRLKVTNKSIFKFTTIARPNGKGLIQTGYDSNNIEALLDVLISETHEIEELYLINKNNVVLTQNTLHDKTPSYLKGEKINFSEIKTVFNLNIPAIKPIGDFFKVFIPVKDYTGYAKYVLYAKVNPESYMKISQTIDKPLEIVSGQLNNVTSKIILNTFLLIIVLIMLVPLIIIFCLRPIKLFERQLKTIANNNTDKNYDVLLYEANFLSSELVGLSLAMQSIIAKNELSLKKQIERDGLSGLYNKVTTEKLISEHLSNGGEGILIMIDIDNFKGINDNLGHDFGDYVIKDVAYKLNSVFMQNDIIGRIGGDEFMVFIKSKNIQIETKCTQLCNAIVTTYSERGIDISISASVGIAMTREVSSNFKDLYLNADIAMYESKKLGKNRFTIYTYSTPSNNDFSAKLEYKNFIES
ncbi:MAG: hypothetical protein ATN32_02200 [Candidatus Epulonipiscium fishelsonii]|nr:MAG: hypothetical protein ATN32_02200 [Epulopiscium sp. AS2M-Bin002]